MVRYELILRLDGAPWLTIIFKPLLTQKKVYKNPEMIPKDVRAARSAALNF